MLYDRLIVAAFLILLAVGALVGAPRLVPPEACQAASVVNGAMTRCVEDHFEQEHPLRDLAISTWTAITYSLLAQGRPGMYVGRDGWLFTAEEIDPQPAEEAHILANLAHISRIADALERRNIHLLVMTLPAKARAHPQLGPAEARRFARRRRLEQLHDHLAARGIDFIDGRRIIDELGGPQAAFLRTDTHWHPDAACHYARVTAAEVARRGWLQHVQRAGGELVNAEPRAHAGDLTSYLPLGWPFDGLAPPTETVSERQWIPATETVSSSALFDDVRFDAVIVGTSYSANRQWSFVACLQAELGVPLLNHASEGGGPIAPMLEFLASDTLANAPPGLVLWEFPERYLGFDFRADAPSTQPDQGDS